MGKMSWSDDLAYKTNPSSRFVSEAEQARFDA